MPEIEAKSEGEKQPSNAEVQPPKVEAKPKTEAAPAPKVEPKVEAKKDEPKGPSATAIGDDDEVPENADLLQLSKTALAKRLTRHTKSELKERFGTDDFDDIKAKLVKFAEYEAEKEAARVAALSEQEKLKEELAEANKRAEKAETKHAKALEQQAFSEYDREAEGVVGTLVADKHVKRVVRELKEHVLTLDDEELKKPKKVFESWAKDFIKENPEFARTAPPEIKKIPITNGADPNGRRERADVDMATKTPKPGQPNSMSKAEFANYKRSRGLS